MGTQCLQLVMRLQRKMLMDMLPAIMVVSMNMNKVIRLKE